MIKLLDWQCWEKGSGGSKKSCLSEILLPDYLFICHLWSAFVSVWGSVLFFCNFVTFPLYLSAYRSVHLPVGLSICLSVCMLLRELHYGWYSIPWYKFVVYIVGTFLSLWDYPHNISFAHIQELTGGELECHDNAVSLISTFFMIFMSKLCKRAGLCHPLFSHGVQKKKKSIFPTRYKGYQIIPFKQIFNKIYHDFCKLDHIILSLYAQKHGLLSSECLANNLWARK